MCCVMFSDLMVGCRLVMFMGVFLGIGGVVLCSCVWLSYDGS